MNIQKKKSVKSDSAYWLLLIVMLWCAPVSWSQQVIVDSDLPDGPAGVVGGGLATPQAFPWMISLRMDDGTGGCGASLIRSEWVLTAGHCAVSFNPNSPSIDKVIINSLIRDVNSLEPHAELIDVDAVIVHEDYNFPFGPDIALLHLSVPSAITPVPLAVYADSLQYEGNMPAKVLGWGLTAAGGSMVDSLKVADCIFVADDTCATMYSNSAQSLYGTNPGGQICAGFFAGTVEAGAAQGDSGGPLFFSDQAGGYKQVGVVSGGNSDVTTEDFPGIFTLIPKYEEWIESTIENYNISLGLSDERKETIEIAYLANDGFRVLGLDESATYDISLIDMTGRAVYNEFSVQGNHQYDLSFERFSSGIYTILIQNKKHGITATEKIAIR